MAVLRVTERQGQILELAAQGQGDKEIALALGLSVHTVRAHLQRLYRAEGLSNRAAAVAAWLGKDELAGKEEEVATAAAYTAAAELPVRTVTAPLQADLINRVRAAAGLQPLAWDERLGQVAESSVRGMAANGHLDTVIGSVAGPDGQPLHAENVGYWSGINDHQLHALFVADPKQRANILGPHSRLGAAWAISEAGVAFLSVVLQ
jgi:DNA-binding CsgD family transcriptional regulator